MTAGKGNIKSIQYFREYFDKEPGEMPKVFRVKYSNSTNELPGIIDLQSNEIKKVKRFRKRSIQIH